MPKKQTAQVEAIANDDLLACRELSVPQLPKKSWDIGDIGIDYITLSPEGSDKPSCVMGIVVKIEDDGSRVLFTPEHYQYNRKTAGQIKSIRCALEFFETLADEMPVKYYRENKQKLENLREFQTPQEWMRCMQWWRDHQEDRPDEYDILCKFLLG